MAGAVQRNARFAIVVLVNGRHSAGVADRRRRNLRSYKVEALKYNLKTMRFRLKIACSYSKPH